MISEKNFLRYQLEIEKRFSELECKNKELEKELALQELRHKYEIEKLQKQTAEPKAETDEEKASREQEAKVASVMQMYSEDPETLRKLGFNLPGDGGVNV